MSDQKLVDVHPLRRWRQRNKRGLRPFAEDCGISFSHLAQIELGQIEQPGHHLIGRFVEMTAGDVSACEIFIWHYHNASRRRRRETPPSLDGE